ncbi:ATP-binding cassette domain-containing protein [Cysteiniphilum halobium]|uniref:ATP-binding cassette domain-containing protein n=1 Tax=Cysteiniphilum halobium TaxID=2219059 RepID=UPI000E64F5A2|nr:ATP-binding cassette domain-containing protein [Cysteiniphilum halobium]
MPIISLRNVELAFGHHKLLDNVSVDIDANKRICLIGRNGAGKSSLFKILQGQILPDHGERIVHDNAKIAWLEQEVPQNTKGSVFNIVLSGFGEVGQLIIEYQQLLMADLTQAQNFDRLNDLQQEIDNSHAWDLQMQAEKVLSALSLDGNALFDDLSGGLKRRVLLAKALVTSPDLLLLDEPTNHLDIESIEFLERFLPQFKGSILFITHDRAFLQNIATDIIELDRGNLLSFPGNYEKFLMQKEAYLHAEEVQNANFDKKLQQEEVWIRQGIKARRTRNEGRVRALKALREERKARRDKQGNVTLSASQANKTGKMVIKAFDISFNYDNKPIFSHFSCEIQRGDKIAILGKNGCGKSTLLQVLLQKLTPQSGTVTHGENLQIAYFDQLRYQIDPKISLVDNVTEGSDYLDINGQKVHVIGYLQNFLFDPKRMQSPASSLSGGERNRLLLAKLFAKPSNVLVLDEPTNDLDVETLEVLEDLILNYQGTVLIVSHDRSFIDNVATSTIVFEDNGQLQEYVGGYEDWLRQKNSTAKSSELSTKPLTKSSSVKTNTNATKKQKLSFAQKKQLAALPDEIEHLEAEIELLQQEIATPQFYQQNKEAVQKTLQTLEQKQILLNDKYQQWENLSEIEAQYEQS